jgi:hypothetical protein
MLKKTLASDFSAEDECKHPSSVVFLSKFELELLIIDYFITN